MAPVLFKWMPLLNKPIDHGKAFKKEPLFGPHKTYRGFFVGILMSMVFVYIQGLLYNNVSEYTLINYSKANLLLLGFLLGFGAMFGDLVKSFIKRRNKIPSGATWIPYDQLDWIIGALVFSSFIVRFKLEEVLIALLIFGTLHPIINIIGYCVKLKNNKL